MMIIIGLVAEIAQEIAETDMPTQRSLQTGGDAEVESEITVTGEAILMIRLEDAARTLLTRGSVAEVKNGGNL
jgi:hypothetical protein